MNARFCIPLALLCFFAPALVANINEKPEDKPISCPPLLASFDEATGMRFRRIALNGLPISAEKEQAKEESDETNEETYVDSHSLQFRHDTSDIYIPLQGGELAFAVKRSVATEVWSENPGGFYGDRPENHMPYDKPFGYCWSSGIGATLRVESYSNGGESSCPSPQPTPYVIATDENGSTYRFARATLATEQDTQGTTDTETAADEGTINAAFMPLPSNRTEKSAFFNRLIAQYGDVENEPGKKEIKKYLLTRKFGTTLEYEGKSRPNNRYRINLDKDGKKQKAVYFHRLKSAVDRFGNKLTFYFKDENQGLIPDEIIAVSGNGERKLLIEHSNGQVDKITDPRGFVWEYKYQPMVDSSIRLLTQVIAPGGAVTEYNYDKQFHLDTTPRSPGETEPVDIFHHLNLTRITSNKLTLNYNTVEGFDENSTYNWTGPERSVQVSYNWDKSTLSEGLISEGEPIPSYRTQEYNPFPSRPMIVTSATVAGAGTATFIPQNGVGADQDGLNGTNYIELDLAVNAETGVLGEVTLNGSRKVEVKDVMQKTRVFEYKNATIINGKEIENRLSRTGGPKAPFYIIAWKQCELTHPIVAGQSSPVKESVTFDLNAGLVDKVVVDYSGNITEYEYEDEFKYSMWLIGAGWGQLVTENQSLFEKLDELPLFSGKYNDPTKETRKIWNPVLNQVEILVKDYEYLSSGSLSPSVHVKPSSRVMKKITESVSGIQSRVTSYQIDSITGNRLNEVITYGGKVKTTNFEYHADLKGFLTKTTVKDAIYNNGVFSDMVTENVPTTDGYGYVGKEIVNPGGLALTTEHVYDANGNRTSTKDPRGNITTYVYDARNRLKKSIAPDTGEGPKNLATIYSPSGQKLATRNENGNVTYYTYDAAGRLTETRIDMGMNGSVEISDLVTSTTYNNFGQPVDAADARGTITHTEYDELARAKSVTIDPGGLNLTTQMFYEGRNVGAWAFNTSGFKPTRTIDARGYETLIVYDGRYLPLQTRKQYHRVSDGNPSSDLYALSTQTYDKIGRVVESKVYRDETNANTAKTTTTQYDLQDRPTVLTDAVGTTEESITETLYTSAVAYRTVDPMGRKTETDYDAAGRAVKAWSADAITGEINRATPGNPTLGSPCLQTQYDAASNPTHTTDPLGRITVTTYDERGRKETVTAPSHTYQLPGGGNSTVTPVTSWTYDGVGNVLTITDPRNTVTKTTYDAANRATSVTAAFGLSEYATTNTVYDANGNTVAVQDPNGNWTRNTYDRANRMTHTAVNPMTGDPSSDPLIPATDDIVVKNTYDEAGNLTMVTDGESQQTAFAYDGLSRKVSLTWDPGKTAAKTDRWYFDALVQTTRIDAKGQVTAYGFDGMLRNTLITYQGRSQDNRVHEYDLKGNLLSVTYPSETVANKVLRGVTQTYDKLNRVLDDTSNGVTHSQTYDKAGNRLLISYGITGRKIVSKYDAYNKLEICWDTVGTVSDPVTYTGQAGDCRTDYVYDVNGSQIIKKLPNGQTTITSYDKLKRALVIETKDLNGVLLSKFDYSQKGIGALATNHPSGYDRVGNVCQVLETVPYQGEEIHSYPNQKPKPRTVTNTYDCAYRLVVEVTWDYDLHWEYRTIGAFTKVSVTNVNRYYYDKANNRSGLKFDGGVEIIEGEDTQETTCYPVAKAFTAAHDFYLRNVYGSSLPPFSGGTWPPETPPVFDPNPPIGPQLPPSNWYYYYYGDGSNGANSNQLVLAPLRSGVSHVYFYDANGNRESVDGVFGDQYSYDYENRLVELNLQTPADASKRGIYKYVYDHRSRRVMRDESQANGQVAQMVFSGGTSVQEHASGAISSSTLQVENIRGNDLGGGIGGLLYTLRGGSSSFNAYNSRGDVISQTDILGVITWQASYEAFGNRTQEIGANNDRQRANTKDEDPTGLLNEGMRYRDLETGSFITRDPAGFVDGPNVYTYVKQNPWTAFDPDGLKRWSFASFCEGLGEKFGSNPVVDAMAPHADKVVGATRATLAVASMVPPISKVADVCDAALDVAEGNYEQAAQTAAMGKMGKVVDKGMDALKTGGQIVKAAIKNSDEAAEFAVKHADEVAKVADSAADTQRVVSETTRCPYPGFCFVAGTTVATGNGPRVIESLRVGERVITPENSSATEVDPADWRKITLRMPNPEASYDMLDIELLRPKNWVDSAGCVSGARLWFELDEIGLNGWAEVQNVAACPEISAGNGRVVLATVTHFNSFVMEVKLDGEEEVLRPTDRHRLFSATRNDWVPTSQLRPGEELRTSSGTKRIASISNVEGVHRVYNIEVESEHCYYVGRSQVLGHNVGCGSPVPGAAESLPPMKGMGATERGEVLTNAGFTQTKVSNSSAKNETWNHADGSEVRVHPYGGVKQTPHKSGNNAHLHKQDAAGKQLDDAGRVNPDPNATHIGLPNPRDFPTVRGRAHGS